MDKKDIRTRLKLLRHTLDMTQSQFAEIMGITQSTYAYIEKGHRASITLDQLLILNKKLDINPNWVLLGEGDMYMSEQKGRYVVNKVEETPERPLVKVGSGSAIESLRYEIDSLKEFLKEQFPQNF
jgi:transcriptional regulator with XRE-family HTH domain